MWKTFKGSDFIRNKSPYIYFSVFLINLILFTVKLYVGLSSNSISIYSDGVNNLFDSLTGILSFVMLYSLLKSSSPFSDYRLRKTEQLLSFVISVSVAFTAFYFAYNSLERLTYPTPVSFSIKYLAVISATAAVKLLMFLFLGGCGRRLSSKVIRLIGLDSLLDFFITGVTVITLLLSKDGKYTVDAFCGIGISIVILVTAVKNVVSSLGLLTETPEKMKRERLEEILENINVKNISFDITEEKTKAFIEIDEADADEAWERSEYITQETGITAFFITENNTKEIHNENN